MAVAEGKVDIGTLPFVLPFVLSKAAGPYSKLDKAKGKELASNLRLLYPYTLSIFTLYAYDAKGIDGFSGLKGLKVKWATSRYGSYEFTTVVTTFFWSKSRYRL